MVDLAVLGLWFDLMILRVLSNLNDSVYWNSEVSEALFSLCGSRLVRSAMSRSPCCLDIHLLSNSPIELWSVVVQFCPLGPSKTIGLCVPR